MITACDNAPRVVASLPPELSEVRRRIELERLELKDAARQIGVGAETLARHLAGEYLRSDSLAKYRRWLACKAAARAEQLTLVQPQAQEPSKPQPAALSGPPSGLFRERDRPNRPHLVVDLFSGAGGMSAGFDLLDSGAFFETVLAIDVEEPMVRVFNANHPRNNGLYPVCRRLDLSDLLNEAEVLSLYLGHLARLREDDQLHQQLEGLPILGLSTFASLISEIDGRFVKELTAIRQSCEYRSDWKLMPAGVMLQTSVIGFHNALELPISSSLAPELGPLVWAEPVPDEWKRRTTGFASCSAVFRKLTASLHAKLQQRWEDQAQQLAARAEGAGRGQLASSAARISSFILFLQSPAMRRIKSLWIRWQSERQALRASTFDEGTHQAVRKLYDQDDRRVSVLLGGPPCQGFSRIGRGKLRSLFDQQVHVQADAEAGDTRNRLLHKYVLFVSALAPSVFLFENVRHFQAEVRTPEGTFLATDVLAEAIQNISSAGLRYEVTSRIIDASRHVVPQARERFFMVGVRSSLAATSPAVKQVADWCLSLPEHDPVAVSVALGGLPEPISINDSRANGTGLEELVEVADVSGYAEGSSTRLMCWLRQDPPTGRRTISARHVDSHHVRAPRQDDAALFELFGPGKRWMDYRCDGAETLGRLRAALDALERVARVVKQERGTSRVHDIVDEVNLKELRELRDATDGSLSLRLLLETITPLPGELSHHLRTSAYLSKRDGNHGDWLARLAGDRPSKTIMSHMAKDTYGYVHPMKPRTLSVREAARIQTFPDWYSFAELGLVEAFRVIGNAVPPLLSHQLAERVAMVVDFAQAGQHSPTSIQPSAAIRMG